MGDDGGQAGQGSLYGEYGASRHQWFSGQSSAHAFHQLNHGDRTGIVVSVSSITEKENERTAACALSLNFPSVVSLILRHSEPTVVSELKASRA